MKKTIIALILAVVAYPGFGQRMGKRSKKKSGKDEGPVEVFAMPAQKTEIFEPLVFGGFIAAKNSRPVATEVQGTLEQVFVTLGQRIGHGQSLFSVRPVGQGLDFRAHVVKSPISGNVAQIKFDPGKLLQAGEIVLLVADLSQIKLDVQVTQADLPYVKLNMPVDLFAGDTPETQATGKALIKAVAPMADPSTGTYQVNLSVDCKAAQPQPCQSAFSIGSFVKVVMKKNVRQGYKLPIKAVVSQERKVLILEKNNKLKWQVVKLGAYYGNEVEVVEGLEDGMQIVTNYSRYPKDGDKAKLTNLEEQRKLIFSKEQPEKSKNDKDTKSH